MGAKKLQPLLLFGVGKDAAMFNSQVVHRSLSLQHPFHQTHIAVHLKIPRAFIIPNTLNHYEKVPPFPSARKYRC